MCEQDDLARAAIPDRDLQLRLIHMLMGGRSANAGPTQSNSTSSDSGNRRMHSSSSVTPGCDDVVRHNMYMPPEATPKKRRISLHSFCVPRCVFCCCAMPLIYGSMLYACTQWMPI